ncbi:conserved hypothetical protein [Gloeothece citriformis PCC 7424]|uniref:Inner membrane protein YqiJ N-terminal domain-containing protein n=1 Tax=Gloeothece citriformis (strain PCC 7424) TaxID=65393 RepID=B7KL43_GLOC7|nr:OB-fold-containig protein [Gloeothece citriformis]ACK72415.1 conserved hypothetical protein [Gloeothece citriformis PCC 7424]
MLFSLANLPYWIFLAIGLALLLLVMFSGGGDEDFELDADADINFQGGTSDLQTDLDFEAHSNSFIFPILGWFGVGKAPLMLLLAINFSTWGLIGWLLNLLLGTLTGKIPVKLFGLGGLVMLLSLGMSLFLGSLISRPLGKIFASFTEDSSSDRLIGCEGTVISKKLPYLIDNKLGQADVLDPMGNLVTVSVSLPQWAKVIPYRGQKILIIDREDHSYIAITKDSSDLDKWLDRANFS